MFVLPFFLINMFVHSFMSPLTFSVGKCYIVASCQCWLRGVHRPRLYYVTVFQETTELSTYRINEHNMLSHSRFICIADTEW